jgi:hypothetical protein
LKRIFIAFLLACISFFYSCSKDYNVKIEESKEAFYNRDYDTAVEKTLERLKDGEKDALLYLVEAGTMLHTAGKYKESNELFFQAVELSEKLKISITKQAGSLLLNERTTNYRGEDFERLLIHMYLGINFIMLDEIESARVEFQKISRMLKEIQDETGMDLSQNIMARYLTAVCYEAVGDIDNDYQAHEFAYLEYKKVHEAKLDLPYIKDDLFRLADKLGDTEDMSKLKEDFGNVPIPDYKNNGELVVIHQKGRGAYKASRGSLLDDNNMRVFIIVSLEGMTLEAGVTIAAILVALQNIEHPIPKYSIPNNRINHLTMRYSDTTLNSKTKTFESVVNTAKISAEKRYEITSKKVAAGIAVKAVATYASAVAAENIAEQTSLSDYSQVIGFVTGATVGATLASQIKPDLRSWQTLPAEFQISRNHLPEGQYEIFVDYVDEKGTVYRTEKRNISIQKGKKTFLNVRSLE